MDLENMTINDIDILIEHLHHEDIVGLRDRLKEVGNNNYLYQALYFDYKKQVWIK